MKQPVVNLELIPEAPAMEPIERAGPPRRTPWMSSSLGRRDRFDRADGSLVESPFLGGFECSCHELESGRRLDLGDSTRHRALADADYARLVGMGIAASREGSPWPLLRRRRGQYDFALLVPVVRAAAKYGVQVIWDLMHFGWPRELDVFAPSFPGHFAVYAAAFAKWLREESDQTPMLAPINEISYLAWAGGDVRCMNPFAAARGVELKVQLVRASIEAIEAIRAVLPRARFVQPEPIINIVPAPEHPKTWRRVESDNLLQFQTWDMLAGRIWPALGGRPDYLDIVGVNFYPDNQFMLDGSTIGRGDPRYKPLSTMLLEVHTRYRRPMLMTETGAEGDARADWLAYVSGECIDALARGCELHGITIYPVLNHPGWADDRHCQNGLWDYADDNGDRPIHEPMAMELRRQTPRLAQARSKMLQRLCSSPSLAAEVR
jgi:hypothetical protein